MKCPSFGLIPMVGEELVTIGGQSHTVHAISGQMEYGGACWGGNAAAISFGGLLIGSYGVFKPHAPGISVKAVGVGPELCYRRRTGFGMCLSAQAEGLEVKDGEAFVLGTLTPQLSVEKHISDSFVARLSASYAQYKLLGSVNEPTSDMTLTIGIGYSR